MNQPGGKGDKRRPRQISAYEEDLRWRLLRAPEKDKPALREELEALRRSEEHWLDYKNKRGVYAHD